MTRKSGLDYIFNETLPDAVSGAWVRVQLGRVTDDQFHLAIDGHLWQPPIAGGRALRSQLGARLFRLRHPKKGARPRTGKRTMVDGLEVGNDEAFIYMTLGGRCMWVRIGDVEKMCAALDRTFELPGDGVTQLQHPLSGFELPRWARD